jgi:hypothetical protein
MPFGTAPPPLCGHLRVAAPDLAELGPRGAAAVVYARLFGLPVLRLRHGRSEPAIRHGVHGATASLPQIREWFADEPDGNLGGRTGRGWLVADLDYKHGIDGPAELARFMAERAVALPPVPYVETPGDGFHLWMRVDGELPSRSGSSRIIPGVDLLADGGRYAVLPPSFRMVKPLRRGGDPPGGQPVPVPYIWALGSCLCWAPMVPAWLAEAMRSMPSIGPSGGGARGGHSGGRPGGWADDPLPPTDELLATGLSPGRRSHDMYRLALRLWRQHGQDGGAAVEAACHRVWLATGQGPDQFGWAEAGRCIRSGREYAAAQDAADARTSAQFLAWLAGRRA